MLTPAERFKPGSATAPETLPAETTAPTTRTNGHGQWASRRVASNGIICVDTQVFSVGKHHGGTIVDIHVTPTVIEVWADNQVLKKVLRQRQGTIRNLRAQTRTDP
jgi:Mu transposase-like protein